MTDPITDEAVDAAVGYLPGIPSDGRELQLMRYTTRAALTAAAPHIAAQATADLRAGIEALRDEWRAGRCACLTCTETRRHADALDALLRGAK